MWIKANEESLIKQSRSFAIPILKLDNRFRTPTMVEYNLNKSIDTIEDSTALEANEKIDLIKNLYVKVSSQGREEFKSYCEQFHAEEITRYSAIV